MKERLYDRLVAGCDRPGGRLARWQDRLTPLQRRVADGCHLNRDVLAALQRAGLEVESVEHFEMPPGHPLVKPAIQGTARRALATGGGCVA